MNFTTLKPRQQNESFRPSPYISSMTPLLAQAPLQVVHTASLLIVLVDDETEGEESDTLAVEEQTDAEQRQARSDSTKGAPGWKRTAQVCDGLGERAHESERHSTSEGVDND